MFAGSTPARATASETATVPNSTAERVRSAEPNLPTGVLTADAIIVDIEPDSRLEWW